MSHLSRLFSLSQDRTTFLSIFFTRSPKEQKGDISMKNNRRNWIVVVVVVVATIANVLGSLRSSNSQESLEQTNQAQKTPPRKQQDRVEFESQFPIADYDPLEEFDSEKKTKRKFKSERYDKRPALVTDELPIDEGEESMLIAHFDSIAGLPAKESEIVIVGEVLDAQAYVSNNKKMVYSEFTIRIDEILKNNSKNITQGSSISVDREGGFVRYKNGKKRLYRIGGQLLPQVGRQYVLFLKNPEKSPNYEIITGYELKADGVVNLDGSPQFIAYRGMDETAFMKAVREAIAQSSQAIPKKEE